MEIEAGGRRIVIEHDTELAHITAEAQRLWDHTAATDDRPGPGSYGFTTQQRWTQHHEATRPAGGNHSRPFQPVTAQQP